MPETELMPKTERKRLAKAELIMFLATTAERWKGEIDSTDPTTIPFDQWPADDPFVTLCRTYQLSPADLARLCVQLGDELERRAIRAEEGPSR